MQLANLNEVKTLIDLGAIFYISHSGGKDSQAMYHAVQSIVPAHQIRVVHADLGDLEHPGTYQHILETIEKVHAHEILVAHAVNHAGERRDFFDMVRGRRAALDLAGRYDAPAWPSSSQRYCTSDLKTGPIWREIRNDGDHAIVVNCVGIRGHESPARAKKIIQRGTLNVNKKNTNSKRDAYDWWPIAHWTDDDVWSEITNGAGQLPHEAYLLSCDHDGERWHNFRVEGNERLSCQFCIFGSRNDLARARQQRPDLYQRYIDLEIEVRSTMFHTESLADRSA